MRIRSYVTTYNSQKNEGAVRLLLQSGRWTNWIIYSNLQEYTLVLMLLQNESPVFCKFGKGEGHIASFYTSKEEVGK